MTQMLRHMPYCFAQPRIIHTRQVVLRATKTPSKGFGSKSVNSSTDVPGTDRAAGEKRVGERFCVGKRHRETLSVAHNCPTTHPMCIRIMVRLYSVATGCQRRCFCIVPTRATSAARGGSAREARLCSGDMSSASDLASAARSVPISIVPTCTHTPPQHNRRWCSPRTLNFKTSATH